MDTFREALGVVTLDLYIADPQAQVVEHDLALWVASGLDRSAIQALRQAAPARADIEAELCRRSGDASIIKVERNRGSGQSVRAWKGLTAGFEVFYRVDRAGNAIVSDHFRNVVSALPVAERAPADEVLCDHFLFRTISGENTLCRSVKRLGRGQTLTIDLGAASAVSPAMGRFDRVENVARPGSPDEYLDRLDEALASVLTPFRAEPGAAVLFSGGVDSTLIHSYLGNAVPAVCYQLPWHAEPFEVDYVGRAARLLGIEVETHLIDLSNYLGMLEAAIDATALPPPHLQLVLYQALLRLDHRKLVVGEQADALFGIELRRARQAALFTSPASRGALKLAGLLIPSRARRLTLIQETATRLAGAPHALDGYAALFGTYTDWPLLEAVFGAERVRERLQQRLDFALGLLPGTAPKARFHQHVELAQMIDYLCEDIMASFRHLAHASGRSIFSPFITRRLLDAARSVPVEERYLRGLEPKHLLKALLKRRLPAYPVKQRKGYTHLPFADMYLRGPLSEVWRRYEVPRPFEGAHRASLTGTPTQMTWNAITLAIWQARVQNNPDLQPVPGSRTFQFHTGAPAPTHGEV